MQLAGTRSWPARLPGLRSWPVRLPGPRPAGGTSSGVDAPGSEHAPAWARSSSLEPPCAYEIMFTIFLPGMGGGVDQACKEFIIYSPPPKKTFLFRFFLFQSF